MTENSVILYHANCTDGLTAAWALHRFLGIKDAYPISYGKSPKDFEKKLRDKVVLVVDFCFNTEQTKELLEMAEAVILLDHHPLAITVTNDLQGYKSSKNTKLNALLSTKFSGAGLAWIFYQLVKDAPNFLQAAQSQNNAFMLDQWGEETLRDVKAFMPPLVRFVEDRDLWTFKHEESRYLYEGLAMRPKNFEALDGLVSRYEENLHLIPPNLQAVIDEGKTVLKFKTAIIKDIINSSKTIRTCEVYGIPVDFHLYNCPGNFASDLCEMVYNSEDAPPFVGAYFISKDLVKFSLRSSKTSNVDVNAIAMAFGGGGHVNASGFVMSLSDFNERFKFKNEQLQQNQF